MQNADRLFGHDIVIVGQQPWDTTIGSNCKNIASVFARKNRVLYVNSPLSRMTAIKEKELKSYSKILNSMIVAQKN